jgi:hypothetical protein
VNPNAAPFVEDNGMKKLLGALAVTALLGLATPAGATPSTVVWTPATTYTQPYLVPHLTMDTYFGETAGVPTDVGLTMGVVPPNRFVEGELGVDGFFPILPDANGATPTKNAFQFNGKLSLKEGALGAWAPGLSVGVMNVGLEEGYNDYNIVHATLGKTLGAFGTVGIGGYLGNEDLLLDENGESDEVGFMASYTSPKLAVGLPGLKDVAFAADFASGKSFFGAVGGAVALYFNDNVSLLTGPVWFLGADSVVDPVYGDDFIWTAQLDVDIPFK